MLSAKLNTIWSGSSFTRGYQLKIRKELAPMATAKKNGATVCHFFVQTGGITKKIETRFSA